MTRVAPHVSVVIPAYTAELYLAQALDSVARQTFAVAEVIVVDDGSTDATAEIAERHGAIVLRRANGGPSAARNTGIARATGEFLAFLDADDYWEPSKTERQMAILTTSPELKIVMCQHRYHVENAELLSRHQLLEVAAGPRDSALPSGWLLHRQLFDEIGPFNEEIHMGEDLEWLLRAQRLGYAPHMIHEPLVVRRVHGENLTADLQAARAGLFSVLRGHLATERRHNDA
ncbi:MAG: glycosyltransferase family 2 protein [Tepidiformaceae bacterium]